VRTCAARRPPARSEPSAAAVCRGGSALACAAAEPSAGHRRSGDGAARQRDGGSAVAAPADGVVVCHIAALGHGRLAAAAQEAGVRRTTRECKHRLLVHAAEAWRLDSQQRGVLHKKPLSCALRELPREQPAGAGPLEPTARPQSVAHNLALGDNTHVLGSLTRPQRKCSPSIGRQSSVRLCANHTQTPE